MKLIDLTLITSFSLVVSLLWIVHINTVVGYLQNENELLAKHKTELTIIITEQAKTINAWKIKEL